VNEYTEDATIDNESISSTGSDENAAHVSNGATVNFNGLTIDRTSSDSSGGDNASFYGVGAAFLNTDGTAYINGGSITTDSQGGAGVFSYDKGVTYVKDLIINTNQDTSGGIHAAGGGTLYAWDVTADTKGGSSAAIRSDRGGGTMVIDGGSYTASGSGSPALYCTADITVNDATLTANGSEGLCLEGLNTVRLFDCELNSNMPENEQNDTTWSVILYQSMSGDSEVGEGAFYMKGGSINSSNGGIFYTTNTESRFYLSGVDIKGADDCEYFLRCSGNANKRGWGSSGSNGADCSFTADGQVMKGDIIWDSISKLDLYMENGSSLTGAIIDNESASGSGSADGYAALYIDETSTWTVTGDSRLSSIHNGGTIADEDGKRVSIVSSSGESFVEGDSEYTVTVDSYEAAAGDFSDATKSVSWEDYEVDMPEAFASGDSEKTVETLEPSKEAAAEDISPEPSNDLQDSTQEADSKSKVLVTIMVVASSLAAAIGIGGLGYILYKSRRKR
nr:carbohydrate-binding domain-containing protein [Lachnospiraceae bacterium]